MADPSGSKTENKFLFSAFDPLGYSGNKVSGWIGGVSKPPKPVLDPPLGSRTGQEIKATIWGALDPQISYMRGSAARCTTCTLLGFTGL